MRISSIGTTVRPNYLLQRTMAKLASGKQINSAADDAAGLAIAEKMKSQSTSYQTANRNIADSRGLLDTTSSSLSGVSNSLQRMRELAMQSSNGTYSAQDRQIMQNEINQLKDQINQVSKGTNFNGISTLNGNQLNLSGTDQAMSFDTTTDSLGISGFDVTGSFDIGSIDKALESVSSMQGSIGGVYNGMGHTMSSNQISDFNIQSSLSRIEDADMARTIMELQQQKLLQRTDLSARKKFMQQMTMSKGNFFQMSV